MRWTPIFWLWISCAIFASTIADAKRDKRDLLTIKKFLISKFFGSGRRKCTGKSLTRRPLKSHEILLVPSRQNFLVEEVPKQVNSEIVKPARNEESFFLGSIRQFLNSEMFRETSEAVREIIGGVLNAEETTTVVNDNPPQATQYTHSGTVTVSQKQPVIEVSDTTMFEYRRPHISNYLPSMIGFANPIISMPRIYSYEQIKGDTVEKFTLDKNSDVVVTYTKKPPRPLYVEDRIKEVILAVPPTTSLFNSDILNSQTATPSYKNQEKSNSDSTKKLQRSYNSRPNEMLQQHLDQVHRSRGFADSTPLPHYKTNLEPTKDSKHYVYIPQESSTNLPTLGLIPKIDNTNIQTRYTYKQETNDGVIQFGNTLNDNSEVKRENSILSNDITAYTSEPIVVAPFNDPTEMSIRGDIPQSS